MKPVDIILTALVVLIVALVVLALRRKSKATGTDPAKIAGAFLAAHKDDAAAALHTLDIMRARLVSAARGHIPPQPLPTSEDQRIADARSIAAPASPSVDAAPELTIPSPTADSEAPTTATTDAPPQPAAVAPHEQQEKAMNVFDNYNAARNAASSAAPTAIRLLRNFKATAALIEAFKACENEFLQYVMFKQTDLRIFQLDLGISANWINAIDSDGLIDGLPVHFYYYDLSSGVFYKRSAAGRPKPIPAPTEDNPTNTWATVDVDGDGNGEPPRFYMPVPPITRSGADIVADFLTKGTRSKYLVAQGLTPEAIAAARGSV